MLAVAREEDLEVEDRERMASLHELLQRVLADPDLTGVEARNLVERNRTEAMLLAQDRPDVVARIRHAPRAYVARQLPPVIVRHATLLEPAPAINDSCKVAVTAVDEAQWWIDVAAP